MLPAPPSSTSKPPSGTLKGNASKDQKERAAAVPGLAKSQPTPTTSSKSQLKASAKPSSPMQAEATPAVPQPRALPQAQPKEVKKEKEIAIAKAGTPEEDPSQDMDVDIGGTPEPEVVVQDSARDGESEEIVRQLEKSLPRWEGFADVGWTGDLTPVSTRVPSVGFIDGKHRTVN